MKNILTLLIAASFGITISANALAQSAIGGAAPKNAGMGAVSPPIKGKCQMGSCTSTPALKPAAAAPPSRPAALVQKRKAI